MTKLKRPKVIIRMGRLSSLQEGLMKMLMTPKMRAVTTMVRTSESPQLRPGTM